MLLLEESYQHWKLVDIRLLRRIGVDDVSDLLEESSTLSNGQVVGGLRYARSYWASNFHHFKLFLGFAKLSFHILNL